MGVWKHFCEQTHMHGFYEFYDSSSKIWKAIWLAATGIAVLATSVLVFNAAYDFIKQPVRIEIEHGKPNQIPYPPMKFCYMHWIGWVDWERVQEKNFTKSELLYALSYISEHIYSSDMFDYFEVEKSVKHKLNSLNMTLKDFYEDIAEGKLPVNHPFMLDPYYINLTVVHKPYQREIFDSRHLMCYIYREETIRKYLKDPKNYRFEVDVQWSFRDNSDLYLTTNEYNMMIQDFIKEWRMYDGDYRDRNPVMFYPDGHSSNFILLRRFIAGYALQVSMSAYIQKHLKKNGEENCDSKEKSLAATHVTSLEYCIEKSRMKFLHKNNIEESWLGFAESISAKKILFLDKTGNVVENATIFRRNKLADLYAREGKLKGISNEMQEIIDTCTGNLKRNGCEVWDIEVNYVEMNPNGRQCIFVYFPKPDQITVMKEVNVQTWMNFVGEVGGMLGILTGASVVTIFQIFHLFFHCYHETD